ncbi:hypothetical protein LS482_17410 [Sinomicrobium kalidii]|uniref:hypothetical protein n=1 Tax=Sinomicrobium kalidii TaxID=2900738 RepID=UPI001E43E3ED|nr:hypothetical protein [Sinomicrobium kalidii]UGU15448.1 hypothetical protein LS482_17410 [Sinomicrobium kalidii]
MFYLTPFILLSQPHLLMKILRHTSICLMFTFLVSPVGLCQEVSPDKINFVRQGVQRMVFNEDQSLKLATLEPENMVGISVMHPTKHYLNTRSNVSLNNNKLVIKSGKKTETGIWFGGFNPFATYEIDLSSVRGEGSLGFKFSDAADKEQFFIKIGFRDSTLTGVNLRIVNKKGVIADKSIAVNVEKTAKVKGRIILQMLGSGCTLFLQDKGLPKVIGQADFNSYIDLRKKYYLQNFQSQLFVQLNNGEVQIKKVGMLFSTGIGLADIRAITYENGDPLLEQGRLWYTMSIRGRGLPHHIQGVFSMNPSVFDVKLEGVILFDRNDGLLRNEIASHIFYDRDNNIWRGITTGFSAYANPGKEKKQLLAIESKRDPRFGFSIMKAVPFGMVGDIEDPHIIFDPEANKWRMLACENQEGYKAIMLESNEWNKNYKPIAGPVKYNSTGTSIQSIGNTRYCFSGSSERKIYIYTYPDLEPAGNLKIDLPPWDQTSGTRVWPNIVQLPEGYPFPYVALMMDRLNYPGQKGPHWSYGALYLYHGYHN